METVVEAEVLSHNILHEEVRKPAARYRKVTRTCIRG
jgi:hypothetical protein